MCYLYVTQGETLTLFQNPYPFNTFLAENSTYMHFLDNGTTTYLAIKLLHLLPRLSTRCHLSLHLLTQPLPI